MFRYSSEEIQKHGSKLPHCQQDGKEGRALWPPNYPSTLPKPFAPFLSGGHRARRSLSYWSKTQSHGQTKPNTSSAADSPNALKNGKAPSPIVSAKAPSGRRNTGTPSSAIPNTSPTACATSARIHAIYQKAPSLSGKATKRRKSDSIRSRRGVPQLRAPPALCIFTYLTAASLTGTTVVPVAVFPDPQTIAANVLHMSLDPSFQGCFVRSPEPCQNLVACSSIPLQREVPQRHFQNPMIRHRRQQDPPKDCFGNFVRRRTSRARWQRVARKETRSSQAQ